ncbi:MAG: hypothetical protein J7J22_02390 [Candidatus Verstraetearchaeota archaeon]|nr:hypothetical protein [Candidatus Verstraetearchaeota archaeon]
MLNHLRLTVKKIERSPVSGILSISFLDEKGMINLSGDFPMDFLKDKLSEGDSVEFVFSTDEIDINELKNLGLPLIVMEVLIFKKVRSEGEYRYYMSCYGLQFRLNSLEEIIKEAEKLNIAFVRIE